ncbi:hypothetical protein MRX96_018898 [Rhipicephalus microplus]
MLAVLALQMGAMYASAMVCDAKRRPYVWLSWGVSCFLSATQVGFIVTWTVAAGQEKRFETLLSVCCNHAGKRPPDDHVMVSSSQLCFLTGMNNYSEIFKKSMEQNGDDNDDSVNASANAAGSRDNSNN